MENEECYTVYAYLQCLILMQWFTCILIPNFSFFI